MLTNLHSTSNYAQELYDFLREHEAYIPTAYSDPIGIPTIGVGYNLREEYIRNTVLQTFGFDVTGQQLTGDAWTAEQDYMDQISDLANSDYPPGTAGTPQLLADLNGVLQQRANDTRYPSTFNRRTAFSFRDEAESLIVFNIVIQKYETRVNTWLGYTMDQSKERIALVSLAYTSKTGKTDLLGAKLKAAITNDNRAEAWYEIRYNSNSDGKHASRRYSEANLFGLYDSGAMTIDQAKEVMRMWTKHEFLETDQTKKMSTYETTYARPQGIASISAEIFNAKNHLVSDDSLTYGKSINNVIVGKGLDSYSYTADEKNNPDDILIGTNDHDLIFGEKGDDSIVAGNGDDVVYGGEGDDYIAGGAGDDVLLGGTGDDTYYYRAGDGNDTIIDTAGNNKIVLDDGDEKLRLGTFYKTGTNTWTTPDGEAQATKNSPLKITLENGGSIQLTGDFQDGDFGIHLKDVPANPSTSNEIIGDQDPEDKTDIIADTPLNDRIEGRTGNDGIWANNGGDNWILGGTGNDVVIVHDDAIGNDIVEGGSGTDIVSGGAGDDKLFGESYTEMQTHITQGETNPNIDAKGDLVSGCTGDDYVYGSDKQDALMGGEGNDLISGGAGDDVIMGDATLSATFIERSLVIDLPDDPSYAFYLLVHSSQRDGVSTYYPILGMPNYYAVAPDKWMLEYSPEGGFTFRNITLEAKTGLDGEAYGGNDVIYAGAGNDAVYAGKGDDEVNAGPGDDIVFGQAGNDIISGGEGNDELQGDEGNDFIDGGSGDDVVYGGEGDDYIAGGAGKDREEYMRMHPLGQV
jgi:Ca2+-binding RTX toxin-like protein/GH24 family phage-related lysozyme (muramidase)